MDNFPLSPSLSPRRVSLIRNCDVIPGPRVSLESETVISDQCLKWTGLGPSTRDPASRSVSRNIRV